VGRGKTFTRILFQGITERARKVRKHVLKRRWLQVRKIEESTHLATGLEEEFRRTG